MKTTIPTNLQGKALYAFLVKHKDQIISEKKSAMKWADPINCIPIFMGTIKERTITVKSADSEGDIVTTDGKSSLKVKVVANTAWFCDSAMDVLTDKCYDQSVKEKGILIPHIADHEWKSTAHVGDVEAVYTQLVSLADLGLTGKGKTTSLIFETLIREDYNSQVYKFYKMKKINQHSIGLLYLSIGLCINDEEYLPEFELWNKYYDKIVNKDLVDERGYFWIVPSAKILENSCVLFGCNELTPTLETEEKSVGTTDDQPERSTENQPAKKTDWNSIHFN